VEQGIKVDMFFGGGVEPFLDLAELGYLARAAIPDEVLSAIPQSLSGMDVYDPERRWFGACLAGFGVIYNKKVLGILGLPEPKTWGDLGRPEYFTWVGSGDPRYSGSVHMCFEIMLQAYGWDEGWGHIMRMGGNIRGFARAGSSVPKDVAAGEVACGMAIDVYAWRQVAESGADRIGFNLPRGLTVVNPDGLGVLKGAPNRELAELFVAFVLSEAGQKLWVLRAGTPGGPRQTNLGRMPVIPGLIKRYAGQAAVTYDPYSFAGGIDYDSAKASARRRILQDLIGAFVIDSHDELVAAWDKVRRVPDSDPLRRHLLEPPIGEQEALDLAQKWNDAEFRATAKGRWTIEARNRYRRIAGGK